MQLTGSKFHCEKKLFSIFNQEKAKTERTAVRKATISSRNNNDDEKNYNFQPIIFIWVT